MFGPQRYFYHGLLKDIVVLFGNLFNDVYIAKAEGNGTESLMKVPLNYGPKSKFLARIELNPSGEVQTNNMVLPRMAFEITGMNYDPLRRVNGQETASVAGVTNKKSVYDAIPYNINISLSIISRNSEDAIQIVEQIIPNFTPEFTLTYEKDFASFSTPIRIPIILESVQNQDEYEGDFKTRRAIVWTLNFTCKTVILSDLKNTSIILNSNVNSGFNAGVFSTADLPDGVEDFFASSGLNADGTFRDGKNRASLSAGVSFGRTSDGEADVSVREGSTTSHGIIRTSVKQGGESDKPRIIRPDVSEEDLNGIPTLDENGNPIPGVGNSCPRKV